MQKSLFRSFFLLKSHISLQSLFYFKQRRCRFDNETDVKHRVHPYRQSTCVRSCRLESVLNLCKCVPMYYKSMLEHGTKNKICSLEHIPCLSRFTGMPFLQMQVKAPIFWLGKYKVINDFGTPVRTLVIQFNLIV